MSWCLFCCLYVTYNQQNAFNIACWNHNAKWPEKLLVLSWKSNMLITHRNKEKNIVLNNRNNHHLRRVGSFCLIWW